MDPHLGRGPAQAVLDLALHDEDPFAYWASRLISAVWGDVWSAGRGCELGCVQTVGVWRLVPDGAVHGKCNAVDPV